MVVKLRYPIKCPGTRRTTERCMFVWDNACMCGPNDLSKLTFVRGVRNSSRINYVRRGKRMMWIAITHALACISTLRFGISCGRDDTQAMHLRIAVAEDTQKTNQLCIYGVYFLLPLIPFPFWKGLYSSFF